MEIENHCHICKNKSEHSLCKNCYVPLFAPVEKHVSFAFLTNIPKEIDNESIKDSIVLDFFKSNLFKAEMNDFSQLRQLRLSHCSKLTTIELTNLPNLISVDSFFCKSVIKAKFSNVPNLIALDLSFCPKLKTIEGEFPKIEYFSISHTKISQIPHLPSVKFVDISSTKITDITALYQYQKLQRLITIENETIDEIEIGKLAQNPSFSSIIGNCPDFDFEGCPKSHNLKNIFLNGEFQNIEKVDLSKTNVCKYTKIMNLICIHKIKYQQCLCFDEPICSGDWYESYRYLYGPYPTPPNDFKQTLSEEEIASITGIYHVPSNVDPNVAAYYIMGTIFGTAIGDCLGIYCEGREEKYVNALIDQPIDITWTHPITTLRGSNFHRGSFTDDTALMLMFIRSIVSTALKNSKEKSTSQKSQDDVSYFFDPIDSGKKIRHWISKGIDEHLDASGIGRGEYTEFVVQHNNYKENPIEVSKKCWINTGKNRTGNGGVMRTGACGCFLFWDEKKVIEIAKQFCQCTHYDPRCVFSATLISLIISRLIQWRCGLIKEFQLDSTIEEVKEMFKANDEYGDGDDDEEEEDNENIDKISDFSIIDHYLYAEKIDDFNLSVHELTTLQTMGCAIWVLRKNFTYEKGIEEIIRAGYDADTNGACAGAVLGAKWGFGAIPLHLLNYLWYGGILYRDTVPFLKTMGMKFDPPSYEEIQKFK